MKLHIDKYLWKDKLKLTNFSRLKIKVIKKMGTKQTSIKKKNGDTKRRTKKNKIDAKKIPKKNLKFS